MSLAAVIESLQQSSGRYDLTRTDLIRLLNAAQRILDSRALSRRLTNGRFIRRLAAGEDCIEVPNLKTLQSVWIHGAESSTKCVLTTNLHTFNSFVTSSTQAAVCCIEVPNRNTQSPADVTIVARTNLENGALVIAAQPPAPTELSILIEDGLLLPLNPDNSITAGNVEIVGTGRDGGDITETVNCDQGAKYYKTTNAFKTVTSITAADFNNLSPGDEKITIKTGRLSFIPNTNPSPLNVTIKFSTKLTEPVNVEVTGEFWQPALANDDDTSVWTEQYPHILILEARALLEAELRNTEGRRDLETAVSELLIDIARDDIAAYESSTPNTIEG